MPVKETNDYKIVTTDGYNMLFDKRDGTMLRWGNTVESDPQVAPLGPELLDLEASTGSCSGLCPWCYKSNTMDSGKHMSLETFQIILDKMGKQLAQVAFGVTDADSNPDFYAMLKHCREKGVIPNYTTSGLGVTEELVALTADVCGAVAVSVYPRSKEIAYETVKRFQLAGVEQTNIHLLYYQENLQFVYEVLHDVVWGEVSPHAVVLLALKAKGRGSNLTPATEKQFSDIVDVAIEDNVPLGFDSCSAPKFERWAKRNGREELLLYSEKCEAACFSSYVNVSGDFFPCSFMEGMEGWEEGISVLDCEGFLNDVWYHPRVIEWRETLLGNCRECPVFDVQRICHARLALPYNSHLHSKQLSISRLSPLPQLCKEVWRPNAPCV